MNRTYSWLLVLSFNALSATAHAAVNCTLTDVRISTYDHMGTYLFGTVNGAAFNWISICGLTNGVQDCTSKATDRRLAVALAAQVQGKPLNLYFWTETTCAQVQPYTVVADVNIGP